MSELLLPEFEEYWGARGWKMDRIVHPSGYIEFRNADTHNIWVVWKQARLSASTPASAWRPISEAPKDGSEIIVWLEDLEHSPMGQVIARWHEPWDQWVLGACLIHLYNSGDPDDDAFPILWQPLPPPPALED